MRIDTMDPDALLTSAEVSRLLGISTWTLRNWRSARRGPPVVYPSRRRVRYRRKDLTTWIDEQAAVDWRPGPDRSGEELTAAELLETVQVAERTLEMVWGLMEKRGLGGETPGVAGGDGPSADGQGDTMPQERSGT